MVVAAFGKKLNTSAIYSHEVQLDDGDDDAHHDPNLTNLIFFQEKKGGKDNGGTRKYNY